MGTVKKAETPHRTEEQEQVAVVKYCTLRHIPIVHIPNEGKRSLSAAARLKAAGMQPGFPDLFIPAARGGACGLFIEMKVGKNKPSDAQEAWLETLNWSGYAVAVCWGFDDAKFVIDHYMAEPVFFDFYGIRLDTKMPTRGTLYRHASGLCQISEDGDARKAYAVDPASVRVLPSTKWIHRRRKE